MVVREAPLSNSQVDESVQSGVADVALECVFVEFQPFAPGGALGGPRVRVCQACVVPERVGGRRRAGRAGGVGRGGTGQDPALLGRPLVPSLERPLDAETAAAPGRRADTAVR